MIHRDIKPENLLVGAQVLILHFIGVYALLAAVKWGRVVNCIFHGFLLLG